MAKTSKRMKSLLMHINDVKSHTILDILHLVKSKANAKFNESIDIAIQLGIDPKKSDQVVRGSVVLPAGTGRFTYVAVFAQGDKAVQALNAGADFVGMEDLAEKIKNNKLNLGIVIASPDTMHVVSTLGQILGPRGLMPNPKVGTVTSDIVTAIKNAKTGQIQFRADKNGIVHSTIGRASFTVEALQKNFNTLLDMLYKVKPPSSKGIYISKCILSSTMGPSIRVEQSILNLNIQK